MKDVAPEDPDTIVMPLNVGRLPGMHLPKRYKSQNIPVYLCNPLPMAMTDVVITGAGFSMETGGTSPSERRYAEVPAGTCLKVEDLDQYIDAEMSVVFEVDYALDGERRRERAWIGRWPGKKGVTFRLKPPAPAPIATPRTD